MFDHLLQLFAIAVILVVTFLIFARIDMRRIARKMGKESNDYINRQFNNAMDYKKIIQRVTMDETHATIQYLATLMGFAICPIDKNEIRIGHIYNGWIGTIFADPNDPDLNRACQLMETLFYETYGREVHTSDGIRKNHCRVAIIHHDHVDEFNRCKEMEVPYHVRPGPFNSSSNWQFGCYVTMEYLINTPQVAWGPMPKLLLH